MMTRRDHRRQVSVIIGGDEAYNRWQIRPLAVYDAKRWPEEPHRYVLNDLGEQHGLADEEPDMVERLSAAWAAWEADVNESAEKYER